MINYKDQSGALTKDPIWGIGSWLLISPVLVPEPPWCLLCFWSGRSLLSSADVWHIFLSGLARLMLGRTDEQSWARADLERKEEAGRPELPGNALCTAVIVTTQKGEQRKLCIWRNLPCSDRDPFSCSSKRGWAQCVAAVQQLNELPHVSHTAAAICVWWMCGVQWGAEEATSPPLLCYFKWLWVCLRLQALISAQLPWGGEPPGCRACSCLPFSKVRSQALLEGDISSHTAHEGIHCDRRSLRPMTMPNTKKASNIYLFKWAFQVIYQ